MHDYAEQLVEQMGVPPYNDDTCLQLLWDIQFSVDSNHAYCPACERERKFNRVWSRRTFACNSCDWQIHPQAGTIFSKSTTPLSMWFLAIYRINTNEYTTIKDVEREIGVTYKTAWRIFHLILEYVLDGQNRRIFSSGPIPQPPKKRSLPRYRRHNISSQYGHNLTAKQWEQLKQAWNQQCAYCEATVPILHRDLIIPFMRGGLYTLSNVVPACPSCNGSKNNKNVIRWLISKHKDPKIFEQRRDQIIAHLMQ